jgi:hypothetical protein
LDDDKMDLQPVFPTAAAFACHPFNFSLQYEARWRELLYGRCQLAKDDSNRRSKVPEAVVHLASWNFCGRVRTKALSCATGDTKLCFVWPPGMEEVSQEVCGINQQIKKLCLWKQEMLPICSHSQAIISLLKKLLNPHGKRVQFCKDTSVAMYVIDTPAASSANPPNKSGHQLKAILRKPKYVALDATRTVSRHRLDDDDTCAELLGVLERSYPSRLQEWLAPKTDDYTFPDIIQQSKAHRLKNGLKMLCDLQVADIPVKETKERQPMVAQMELEVEVRVEEEAPLEDTVGNAPSVSMPSQCGANYAVDESVDGLGRVLVQEGARVVRRSARLMRRQPGLGSMFVMESSHDRPVRRSCRLLQGS